MIERDLPASLGTPFGTFSNEELVFRWAGGGFYPQECRIALLDREAVCLAKVDEVRATVETSGVCAEQHLSPAASTIAAVATVAAAATAATASALSRAP